MTQSAGADLALLHEEKRFYEVFWDRVEALLGNPDLMRVFYHFGPQVFRRSSVLEGLEAFLDAHQIGGRRCVEIGTCKGLTAILLARRFDEVVTIDVVADPEREAIAAAAGVANIRFVTVPDNGGKAGVIHPLDFDCAYVDGDHARDTETDFALVHRCGRVLFHEYWPPQPAVVALVDRLRAAGRVEIAGKLALWRAA